MSNNLSSDRWISLQEVCKCLVVKCHTILCWIYLGNIPTLKIKKLWVFKILDIDIWGKSAGASDEQEVLT